MRSWLGTALVLPVLVGIGPCGPIPGGALSGPVYDGPESDWTASEDLGPCALEVRPDEPYSVTLRCFELEGRLHVGAPDAPGKTWARLLLAQPYARLRIGDRITERRALRLETEAERRAAWQARRAAGGEAPVGEGPGPDDWFFRLDPRSADRGGGRVVVGDTLRSGEKLYSQEDEELIIRDFFRDRRGGFFVDVGAWLPKKNSTTYYLEHHLGWSGIAIDALKEMAPGYASERPRTRFFNFIVTDHSGATETLYSAGPVSTIHPEFLEGLSMGTGRVRPVRVPTITLNDLLDREGVTQIDFLSMDIEGSEPTALAGFDIERFRPELLCIEAGRADRPDAVAGYFARHGYVQIRAYLDYDRVNAWFAPAAPR